MKGQEESPGKRYVDIDGAVGPQRTIMNTLFKEKEHFRRGAPKATFS